MKRQEDQMPHFTLEYSENILEQVDTQDVFKSLHAILIDNGPFNLSDIKSRAIMHKDFYVADGNPSNSFVHLTLSIFKGRDTNTRQAIGNALVEFLKNKFERSYQELKCSITVDIKEIDSDTYAKISNV
jgi:5-carboxymethyl-2-hydroxymuconate isomerase